MMGRLTLRGLWAHKTRLVGSALAVILGVAFVAGSLVLTDTLKRVFTDLFSDVYAETSAVVRATTPLDATTGFGLRPRVDESLVEQVKAVPGVRAVDVNVQGTAIAIDKDNKAIVANAPSFGFVWGTVPETNPYKLAEGSPPAADDQIVVDRGIALRGDLSVGDRIKVQTFGATEQFTVSGIATFGSANSAGGATAIGFTKAAAQRLFNAQGQVDEILVVAEPTVTPEELVQRLDAAIVDPNAEVLTGAAVAKEQSDSFNEFIGGFLGTFLNIFAGVAVFVGLLVIYNSFTIVIAQRLRETALLRAIGASRPQVLRSILLEVLAMGAIASVIGLAVGVLLAVGLKSLFAAVGFELPSGPLVIAPRTIIVGLVVGLGATLVSTFLPAIKASGVPPLAALRDVAYERTERRAVRLGVGLVMLVAGITLLLLGLNSWNGNGALAGVAVGAVLVLLGARVLLPVYARPLVRVLGSKVVAVVVVALAVLLALSAAGTLLGGLLGGSVPGAVAGVLGGSVLGLLAVALFRTGLAGWRVTGRFGRENAMRSPKRTASSASTLMIGIGVVTTILVFAASLTKTFEGQLAQLLRSNYVVTDATGFLGFPTKVAELLAEVPGVQEVVPYRQNAFRAFGEDQQVSGIDGALIGDVLDVGEVRGDLAALAEPDTVAVSRQVAEDEGLDLGDTIAATFPEGERRLRVVAVYEETTPLGSYTIGFEQFRQRFPAFDNDQFVFVKADDGGDPAALQERVDRALFDYPTASFKSNAQFRDDQIGQFQQFLVLVYALLVLSLVIALFGIANTLALSVFERTREIGLMRAVGMDRDQTRGVVRWEGIIVSLLGALVGVLVGVGFGVALVNAASSQDNPLSLSVPPDQLVLVAFMAIVFGLLASLLAGRRAARLDVLDAIATE